MITRLRHWLNDLRYRHSFHVRCRSCGAEIHAWTNSVQVAARVAATWRASHDRCSKPPRTLARDLGLSDQP